MAKYKIKNLLSDAEKAVRIYRVNKEGSIVSNPQFTLLDPLCSSIGIILGVTAKISCDGAYDTIGIQGNLDYSTGWTIYLNGQDYGRATDETPLEYRSSWEFDLKIEKYSDEGNILWITNSSGSDLRLQLKPDTPLTNMSMTFIDSDIDYPQRLSENVLVMDDGSINVCLRNGSAGSSSGLE